MAERVWTPCEHFCRIRDKNSGTLITLPHRPDIAGRDKLAEVRGPPLQLIQGSSTSLDFSASALVSC